MKDANLPKETRFKVEGLEVHPQASPIERLRRIMELLKQNMGKLNREIIYQIMSDHNNQEPDDFTVCTHGEASTLASTIIIPKKREFWTTDNLPCQSNPELFKL